MSDHERMAMRCTCEHGWRDHTTTTIEWNFDAAAWVVVLGRCKGGRCECPDFDPQYGSTSQQDGPA